MAGDKVPAGQEQKLEGSSIIRVLVTGGISIIVPALCAVLVFLFFLKPMLVTQIQGNEVVSTPTDSGDVIPPNAVIVKFDEAQATVITPRNDAPSPLFIYQVAMSCSDAEVASLIEGKKEYFTAMINKIHRNKTRVELNDPAVQEALLRQTKEEANQLIRKLSPGLKGKVLEVMYLKYTIVDI
ncbi:MAG: hypothetical protein N3G21_07820 [Candidatus Hydrogenedentes bacterium]|nr:hypothetical protein [Candidatus Hydrogenedentota bacterium]